MADGEYQLDKHPGWEEYSYGYHGDDGKVFHCSGGGSPWGPLYQTGDTIGCGVNFKTNEVRLLFSSPPRLPLFSSSPTLSDLLD